MLSTCSSLEPIESKRRSNALRVQANVTKKPDLDTYINDLLMKLEFAEFSAADRHYNLQMNNIKSQIETSQLMTMLADSLTDMPKYYLQEPDLLFFNNQISKDLSFKLKPLKSVFNKIYRKNVYYNNKYPEQNKKENYDVKNFYEEIDDLLRTRLVCKYMDGPKWVCDLLERQLTDAGAVVKVRELSTDQGYYAWHLYIQNPVEMLDSKLVRDKKVWIEIQFTTQLSEVITSLTHDLYQRNREGMNVPNKRDWKWDAKSQFFRSSFLGHALHLFEGIIQEFRDEVLSQRKNIQDKNLSERFAEVEVDQFPDQVCDRELKD